MGKHVQRATVLPNMKNRRVLYEDVFFTPFHKWESALKPLPFRL